MRSTLPILLCTLLVTGCQQSGAPATSGEGTKPNAERRQATKPEALRYSDAKEVVLSIGSMKFKLDLDSDQTTDAPAAQRAEQEQMDVQPTQEQPDTLPTGLSGLGLRGRKMLLTDWEASASDLQGVLAGDAVQPLTEMKFEPDASATYFFVTRDGTVGILQLVALVEAPKGIRVRYKTLTPIAP